MRAAIVIGLMMLGVTALAAPPATKPTTRPDPNSVVVEFAELGFRLSVPKAWKAAQNTANVKSFEVPGGAFVILAGRVKPGDADLTKQVELKKTRLEGSVKGYKVVRDQATTLGSQPAWVLVYDATLVGKVVDPKTGKQGAGTITAANRVMEVTCVNGQVLVQVSFVCGDKQFDSRVKLAEKALASFEWTTPASKQ